MSYFFLMLKHVNKKKQLANNPPLSADSECYLFIVHRNLKMKDPIRVLSCCCQKILMAVLPRLRYICRRLHKAIGKQGFQSSLAESWGSS